MKTKNPNNKKVKDYLEKNKAANTSLETNNISLVKVRSGNLILENCIITYEFLSKAIHREIPAITLFPKTETLIMRSHIVGHINYRTIGILAIDADFQIKNSYIRGHLLGGISAFMMNDKIIQVFNSTIHKNSNFGIQISGISGTVNIENSRILSNKGNGLFLTGAVHYKVWNNEIEENKTGCEVVSTTANFLKNKIKKNKQNGVVLRTVDDIFCNCKMIFNLISKNKLNGILIEGR
jgi:hypothetical protein